MVQKTRAAINTWFKIRYHKRQSSSVLLLVLPILCSLISRLFFVWYICSAHIYYICTYIFLNFRQPATYSTYNVIFFPNTWIRFIYRFVHALTRVHFSHFRKIRSFFFQLSFFHPRHRLSPHRSPPYVRHPTRFNYALGPLAFIFALSRDTRTRRHNLLCARASRPLPHGIPRRSSPLRSS